ncbi:MAG: glycoside hydrolase family 88 protein [Candidatus Rokubacteria bacterium]|nr:glycoside hydrolase family 88 protein [Candidatus Rokubacteria bacterium]
MGEGLWNDALSRMRARVVKIAEGVREGFPHFADPETGRWTCSPTGDWTGGFWNGMLWLSAAGARERRYLQWAEQWTERLRARIDSDTVFRGFLFYYGAALGGMLLNHRGAREIGLLGAKGLASMYNPRAEALPLGSEAEEASDVGKGEANVDTVQASALLLWAHRETGDPGLREIALKHAARHIEFCLREDGSVCQSASFEPATGTILRRYTHKGITDQSTWARAQAWGILGWTLTAQWSGDLRFLEPAERAADWWLAHVPDDWVAFWDFDDPAIPETNRDTSATAIVAASLLKLAALTRSEARRLVYRQAAEVTARALVEGSLGADGILRDGCYNKRIGLAIRHELVWGSYYLYEALHGLAATLDPARV